MGGARQEGREGGRKRGRRFPSFSLAGVPPHVLEPLLLLVLKLLLRLLVLLLRPTEPLSSCLRRRRAVTAFPPLSVTGAASVATTLPSASRMMSEERVADAREDLRSTTTTHVSVEAVHAASVEPRGMLSWVPATTREGRGHVAGG